MPSRSGMTRKPHILYSSRYKNPITLVFLPPHLAFQSYTSSVPASPPFLNAAGTTNVVNVPPLFSQTRNPQVVPAGIGLHPIEIQQRVQFSLCPRGLPSSPFFLPPYLHPSFLFYFLVSTWWVHIGGGWDFFSHRRVLLIFSAARRLR